MIHFVDISGLPEEATGGYPRAVLIGQVLSREYLRMIIDTPDYVERMVRGGKIEEDEFHSMETGTDRLADELAGMLESNGYIALSQSERNLIELGRYCEATKTSPLPHKSVALLAGLGWIGRHDLLVTPEFGSAVSMCTVLTDAPFDTQNRRSPLSECGNCTECIDACMPGALRGVDWHAGVSRDEMVDIHACTTCLRCMAMCPWTVRYAGL